MKQESKNERFDNQNVSKYFLRIKDDLLENEYLTASFDKDRFRGKVVGLALLISHIAFMILYLNKDAYFVDKQFLLINSLTCLDYIILIAVHYARFPVVQVLHPILLFCLMLLQGFNENFMQDYYQNYLQSKENSSLKQIINYCNDYTYQADMRTVSSVLIYLFLVGCIVSFRFRIYLSICYIICVQIWGIYYIDGSYERAFAVIFCLLTLLVVILHFYVSERTLRRAFLRIKRGKIYQETIDKVIPQNVITAGFDQAMGRMNFYSSNSEAAKTLGVTNESNFEQFLESCQIDKLETSPFLSAIEFEQTSKRITGLNSALTLKHICKEILIKQNLNSMSQQKPRSSFWGQQQNQDLNSNLGQINSTFKQSGTLQQVGSQCALQPTLLSKRMSSRNQSKKTSMKLVELKPINKRSSHLQHLQSNMGLFSVNDVNTSFHGSDTVNQINTLNYLHINTKPTSSPSTAYSSFSGEIKQEDGVKKKVNIRIWSYKLIQDFVVICIEDQSFKQQFTAQKDKNIVMQFFLQYYLNKQEDLTKQSLAEQKLAYSCLRDPLIHQRHKTIALDHQPSMSFTQQTKKVQISSFHENIDSISFIESPKNYTNYTTGNPNQNQNIMNNYITTNQKVEISPYLNQNPLQNISTQQSAHIQNYRSINNVRILLQNSPLINPSTTPQINTEMQGSQMDDINQEMVADDRKTIHSQPKYYQQYSKSNNQKRLESADTSLHVDWQQNKISNFNDMDSKQTATHLQLPQSHENTNHDQDNRQIQKSFGDATNTSCQMSSSLSNSSTQNNDQLPHQIADIPKMKVDEIIETKTPNYPYQDGQGYYRKIQQLKESKSLSPKNNLNIERRYSQFLNQTRKENNTSKVNSPLSSSSFKKIQRSQTYHISSNETQQGNNYLLPVKLNNYQYPKKLSFVKTLSTHQEKPLSESEDEFFMKLQKVGGGGGTQQQSQQQQQTYSSKVSISSQQNFGQMYQYLSEQQSPSQTFERGRKPSIFQTLARSPTNETDKTQKYNTDDQQNMMSTMVNAVKKVQKIDFYLSQSKYLTQNYSIMQSFLFSNRSFKYSLLNTEIIDLIKGILQTCSPLIEKKCLRVLVSDKNLDDESNKTLYQDKERLSIMLFNILFNTLTYCKKNSQISIYFQSMEEITKEENGQNSILVQDQMHTSQDLNLINNANFTAINQFNSNNVTRDEDYFKDLNNNQINKTANPSLVNILFSPTKSQTKENALKKQMSISSVNNNNNNFKENNQIDTNELKLIIVNECEDQFSALYKIEESNKTTPEQLLTAAMQIIQTTNQSEQASTPQTPLPSNNMHLFEPTKNAVQYIFKKRISQQYQPERLFSQPSEDNNVQGNRQLFKRNTLNSGGNGSNLMQTREPSQSVYFNQLSQKSNQLKIGIAVAKFILKKIGPYEKITYSAHNSSQIKTELVVYKDLRQLEPEQPLKSRQTIVSQLPSQNSTQNIPLDREIKSRFYNNNTSIQHKSQSSKTQIAIPILDQVNDINIDKMGNDDEHSISKQMIDQKIKRKFGEQPIYFEDVNEREKHNSSAISEDFSRVSIPHERHQVLSSQQIKAIEFNKLFSPKNKKY